MKIWKYEFYKNEFIEFKVGEIQAKMIEENKIFSKKDYIYLKKVNKWKLFWLPKNKMEKLKKPKIWDVIYNSDGTPTHIVWTDKNWKIILKKYNPMNYKEWGVF